MLNRIKFFCVDESGSPLYHHVVEQALSLSLETSLYLGEVLDKVGLDSVFFTVMVEVVTNTRSRSSVVGHYIFGNGIITPVDVGCMRLSREVHSV